MGIAAIFLWCLIVPTCVQGFSFGASIKSAETAPDGKLFMASSIQGFSLVLMKQHARTAPDIKLFMASSSTESVAEEDAVEHDESPDPDSSDTITSKQFKQWQKENDPEEYWFNPVIHTLGNTGFFGAVHAAVGAASTKIIDKVAYKGRDIRSVVANELKDRVLENKQDNSTSIRVLDMACGVGMSTRALKKAFDGIENVTIIGLDTSPEMVEMSELLTVHESDLETAKKPGGFRYFVRKTARRLTRRKPLSRQIEAAEVSNITFFVGNAEATPFLEGNFDLVTVMYCFHEVPEYGRDAIIKEARRLLKPGGIFAVVDISTDYTPSESMLSGEPYVIEYQQNINEQLANFSGFKTLTNEVIEPNHVELWQLVRNEMSVYEANQF